MGTNSQLMEQKLQSSSSAPILNLVRQSLACRKLATWVKPFSNQVWLLHAH